MNITKLKKNITSAKVLLELEEQTAQENPNNFALSLSISSLKAHVQDLETQLTNTQRCNAELTFNGNPVNKSQGIQAKFATTLTQLFVESVSTLSGKNSKPIFITDIALGSFGFQLEIPSACEPLNPDLFGANETPEELAIIKIQRLFKLIAEGSENTDDELAELIDGMPIMGVRKIEKFLSELALHKAWCGLGFKETKFKFEDVTQVENSMKHLKEDNIKETKETLQGEFQSFSIGKKDFQFLIQGENKPISGKVDVNIDITKELSQKYLWKSVKVQFSLRTIGKRRPRYTFENWNAIQITTES